MHILRHFVNTFDIPCSLIEDFAFFYYNITMIKLIAFLGNYGSEYEGTRHNVAWEFEKSLPFASKLNWTQKFKGEYCSVDFSTVIEWFFQSGLLLKKDGSKPELPDTAPDKIYFLKPLTYMNLSGESIIELAHFFKINADEIMVIHDELELPLGTVSLKFGGGLGGHNGLRSTKSVLNTPDFWRLRFGLTKPVNRDIADYVLSRFTSEENITLKLAFEKALEILGKTIFSKDPSKLIDKYKKVSVC